MSDINMPQKNGKRKLQSPRVDLTPMVDLGFLLITFFIFTTTMANPKTMEVNMPFKTPEPGTVFIDTSTIILIPVKNHKVVYYHGQFNSGSPVKETAMKNIRQLLLDKQNKLKALPGSLSEQAHELQVLIKPNSDCTYEDVVNILDEMSILRVKYYAIDELSPEEQAWLVHP